MKIRQIPALVILLSFLAAGPVRAQGDIDLLTASAAVPPNVILLFDTSKYMNHLLWYNDPSDAANFDTSVLYPGTCDLPTATAIAGSDPASYRLEGEELDCAACPTAIAAQQGGDCELKNMDTCSPTSTSNVTFFSLNYLNWYLGRFNAGTAPTIPSETRICAAKTVLDSLIDDVNPDLGGGKVEENVRFGLAEFHQGGDPADANGGYVSSPPIVGNKTSIRSQIKSLKGEGWSPLGEALIDIGRYFAGDHLLGSFPKYNKNGTGGTTGKPQSSPIDLACRKNFVIVMSSGEPTQDLNDHYGTAFTDTIGTGDGDSDDPDSRTDAPPYAENGSDWLDDVALHLYETDLVPDSVMAGKQNVITYTVGFMLDHPLLRDTALNGHGRYYVASSAAELSTRLREALTDIIERSTAFAAATVPTSRTVFGDGFYTASFVPSGSDSFWAGSLQAYQLGPDLVVRDINGDPAIDPNTNLFKEPRAPFWDAADEMLKATHPVRKLFTTKGGVRTNFDTAGISAADLGVTAGDLALYPNDPNVPFATIETLADALVDYVGGLDAFDKDRDTLTSEKRIAVLGDIFHSSPIVIGTPSHVRGQEPGFGPAHDPTSFLGQYAERDRKLYVGANDGLLHGFDAGVFRAGDNPATTTKENGYYDMGTGRETFGYVPGLLLDQIKFLPRNLPRQYYFVDGTPAAADVWLPSSSADTSKEATEWATVLITGMRQGGSGYIALDVTDPSATSGNHGPYPKLLWEFDESDAALGEAWSDPVIARVKLRLGTNDFCGHDDGDGGCREQWVAIFGGGYRADGDPNLLSYISDPSDATWTANSKGIFMVAIDTGALIGKVVFDTDPAKILNGMRYSIPSTPSVLDLDFDGFADVVYVGDLGGQMWKWDLTAVGEDTTADGVMDNWPAGLFFAADPASMGAGNFHYHSIFFPPVATYLNGNLVLTFSSGERTDLNYEGPSNKDDNNRFWVVWDSEPLGTDPSTWYVLHEGHKTIGATTRGLNDVTSLATDPDPDDDGYFIIIPDGEKFITNHVLFGGVLLALSYVPDNSGTNICDPVGDTHVWMFNLDDAGGLIDVSAAAGNAQRNRYLGPGAPTDPRITITSNKVVLIGQTSLGNVFEFDIPVDPPPPIQLVFWRQLF